MPIMRLSNATMQLVRTHRPNGFELGGSLLRLEDGGWLVAINDYVALIVAAERVPSETDDGVISRLVRDWPQGVALHLEGMRRKIPRPPVAPDDCAAN